MIKNKNELTPNKILELENPIKKIAKTVLESEKVLATQTLDIERKDLETERKDLETKRKDLETERKDFDIERKDFDIEKVLSIDRSKNIIILLKEIEYEKSLVHKTLVLATSSLAISTQLIKQIEGKQTKIVSKDIYNPNSSILLKKRNDVYKNCYK